MQSHCLRGARSAALRGPLGAEPDWLRAIASPLALPRRHGQSLAPRLRELPGIRRGNDPSGIADQDRRVSDVRDHSGNAAGHRFAHHIGEALGTSSYAETLDKVLESLLTVLDHHALLSEDEKMAVLII